MSIINLIRTNFNVILSVMALAALFQIVVFTSPEIASQSMVTIVDLQDASAANLS